MHSGSYFKMAVLQSLWSGKAVHVNMLFRPSLFRNPIFWNSRCITQQMMNHDNEKKKMCREAKSGLFREIYEGPYHLPHIRPMSSQSQGSFLTDLKSSPSPALFLGFFGAVPFTGLAGMSIFLPEHMELIVHAQQAYGACILSFLGAIHWGYALAKNSGLKPDWSTLGYSVTPSLIAWTALLVNPLPGLVTLCVGLAFALSKDLKTPHFPVWYYSLRKALTTLAVGSVAFTAAVFYFH